MRNYEPPDDHQPVTWLAGRPIYAAHFLGVIFVASMLVTTAVMAFHGTAIFAWLPFTSAAVLAGQVWRLATYGFVNPPSLWFVVEMFMLVWFGRELERFFGRRLFLRFYACLYFLTPLLFTLIGLRWPMTLLGESGSFALFIGFATLYPDAMMLFNILAKWAAVILVGISTLIALSRNDWATLISLWAGTAFAWAFVRYQQGRLRLPTLRLPRGSSGSATPRVRERAAPADDAMTEIDALLDKIARSGFGSLTAKERAKLEAARVKIARKAGRPPLD